jgi:molecular chaperone HtpG
MHLSYPLAFEHLLARDRHLRGRFDELGIIFDAWLTTSRVPFFTDYTDHGIDHLNQVLATADQLISGSARSAFTPGDAAVLIAATLFHDAALHLSESGFYDLIRGQASEWAISAFGDPSWSILWDEEFLFSAKRWDENRLRQVLVDFRESR